MASALIKDINALVSANKLSLQDVIEINECVLKMYISQREKEIREHCSDDSGGDAISVDSDSEGDYIDKNGNIYDISSKELIGKKDLKTKEKTMYNVV